MAFISRLVVTVVRMYPLSPSLPPFLYISQYIHVFISDVTVLVPVLKDNSHHAFAVYTSDSTKQRWPLILSAQTEKDMADWVCLERPPFRYKQHT